MLVLIILALPLFCVLALMGYLTLSAGRFESEGGDAARRLEMLSNDAEREREARRVAEEALAAKVEECALLEMQKTSLQGELVEARNLR